MKKYNVWYELNHFDAEIFAENEAEAYDNATTLVYAKYGFCDSDFLFIEEVE